MKKTGVLIALLAGTVLALVVSGCGPATSGECVDQAVAAAANGDWHRARKLTDRAVRLAPGNVDVLVFNAISALRCGEAERAYASASEAVNLAPGSFIAQYTLGRVCMESPEHKGEAMRALLNALKLRRDDRDTLVLLCNLGIEVASPNALSFLNMLKRDPEFAESAELYNQTALAYLRRNDVGNARRALVEAWRLGRSDAAINYNAGCFFDRYAKSRPLALKFYRTYMKISENLAAEAAYRTEVAARLAALEEKR